MATAIVILAIWTVLSIPMSVLLGSCLKDANPPELVGMDGPFAVFQSADGAIRRVSLGERTAA